MKTKAKQGNRLVSRSMTILIGGLVVVVAAMGYFLVRRLWIAPPVDAMIERTDFLVQKGEQIQLNILNGSGKDGIARQTMDFLRARGFDVVEITNYTRFDVEHSFVIDRVGDSVSAKKVLYALSIPDSLLRVDIDSTLYLRCSVVLGRDFTQLKPFRK